MKTTYTTKGTCAKFIDIEIAGKEVKQVKFEGGCRGNAQGISSLVTGMAMDEVIEKLKGIKCRGNTSCPDQLAAALEQLALKKAS